MEDPTDDALIKSYIDRRDWLADRAKWFEEQMAPFKEQMKTLETEMHRRLLERGATNTKSESGIAYIEKTMQVKCDDKEAMLDWAFVNYEDWGKNLLTAHVSKETVQSYLDQTKDEEHPEGQLPPGISVNFNLKVIFRKG